MASGEESREVNDSLLGAFEPETHVIKAAMTTMGSGTVLQAA